MPYIGNTIRAADDYRLIDDISSGFNGSTTSFALQVAGSAPVPFPKSPQQVLISVNGVIQEPDPTGSSGFNLVGTNIVFSSAPTNGHAFFGIIYATADYLNAGGNFPAGSLGAPSITFIGDENSGLFRKSGGSVGFVSDATEIANFDSNGITISSGNLIIPDSIIHNGDTNTKIRFPAADTVTIETAGSERLRVVSSGKVGIGETSPDSLLHLKDSTDGGVSLSNLISISRRNGGSNDAVIQTLHDGSDGISGLTLKFASAEKIRIKNDGKVGIGTTSPSEALHVTGGHGAGVLISSGGTTSGGVLNLQNEQGSNQKFSLAVGGGDNAYISGRGLLLRDETNSANRVALLTNGNVGIGTTSPSFKLTVSSSENNLFLKQDTGDHGYILDVNQGDGSLAFNRRLSGSDTTRMFVDSSGNVGIGTSSPESFGGSHVTLEVAGTGTGQGGVFKTATSDSAGTGTNGTEMIMFTSNTQGAINVVSSDPLTFSTANTERMRIASNGIVEIAASGAIAGFSSSAVTSNIAPLKIYKSHGSTHAAIQLIWDHFNTNASIQQRIQFTIGDDAGADGFNNAGFIAIEKVDSWQSGAGRNSALVFGTTAAASESEKMRIDQAGRVLIGTTTSHTTGSETRLQVFAPSDGSIFLGQTNVSSSGTATINFAPSNAVTGSQIQCVAEEDFSTSANRSARLTLSTRKDGSLEERIRITDDGDIRFGNTTGSNSYHPHQNNGGTSAGVMFNAGTDAANYAIDAQSDSIVLICNKTQGNGVAIEIKKDATVVGSISVSGSNTSYNTSSDYRLKENVVNITDGITRVKQLIPRRFNWISDDTNTLQDGFLAHEVQSVVPESVQGEKDEIAGANYKGHSGISEGDPVYQEMDNSKLIPLLTAALQEEITKREALETRIAALETA